MSIVIDYTKGFFEAAPSGETVGDIAGSATLDLASGNVFSYTPAADTTFVFSNPPASGAAYGMTLKVTGASVGSSYDIANASYDSVSFSVAAQETRPSGIDFNSDGTKMYVLGADSDAVHSYTLSSSFDVSTASYDSVSFSVSPQTTFPIELFFRPDGTKMYVCDGNSYNVHQYSLSSAFDISTASYDSKTLSIGPYGANGLYIKPDGTVVYATTSNSILQYSLSTAWDVSTGSLDKSQNLSLPAAALRGLSFNPDGSEFFVLFSDTYDDVLRYDMTTNWDVGTSSYSGVSFAIGSQEGTPELFKIVNSGLAMVVSGYTNNTVYQYSIGAAPAPATLTYPATVDWPSGTAPDAPAAGETDVLAFYTDDGGTNWYGFQAGDAMA